MSIEHIWEHIGWTWYNAMNNRRAFAKAPNEWMKTGHNMCGCWVTRSPLWWRPCSSYFQTSSWERLNDALLQCWKCWTMSVDMWFFFDKQSTINRWSICSVWPENEIRIKSTSSNNWCRCVYPAQENNFCFFVVVFFVCFQFLHETVSNRTKLAFGIMV